MNWKSLEGQTVDVVWNMPKGGAVATFDVLDTKNVKVKKVEQFFDDNWFAYFEDKVYVPVRVERLRLKTL